MIKGHTDAIDKALSAFISMVTLYVSFRHSKAEKKQLFPNQDVERGEAMNHWTVTFFGTVTLTFRHKDNLEAF